MSGVEVLIKFAAFADSHSSSRPSILSQEMSRVAESSQRAEIALPCEKRRAIFLIICRASSAEKIDCRLTYRGRVARTSESSESRN